MPKITIQNHSANSASGEYSVLVGYGATGPDYSVGFGAFCNPGATGRVAFNNVESVVGVTGDSMQHISALIPVQWNNTLYRVPVLSSTGTDLHVHMAKMAIGELWYQNASGTATSGINTAGGIHLAPTMTLVTTSNLMSIDYFDEPVNGRLRYVGTETQTFHMAFSLSASCGSANQALSFWIKKDGVTESKSIYYFTSITGGNNFTIASHVVLQLATNSYVEIWSENSTASNEITVKNLNLLMMSDGS